MELLFKNEVYKRLRKECKRAGSQKNWASQHNVSPQYLGDVLSGKRDLGPLILKALRLTEGDILFATEGEKVTKEAVMKKLKEMAEEKKRQDAAAEKRKKSIAALKYD
jgi:hypothetical protein